MRDEHLACGSRQRGLGRGCIRLDRGRDSPLREMELASQALAAVFRGNKDLQAAVIDYELTCALGSLPPQKGGERCGDPMNDLAIGSLYYHRCRGRERALFFDTTTIHREVVKPSAGGRLRA